jgi:hypothetical protein
MKKTYSMYLVLLLCCCGLLVCGQSKRASRAARAAAKSGQVLSIPADAISVDMSLSRPPSYVVEGKKVRINNAGGAENLRQWMVNEISFAIVYRGRSSRPILLENVKVELYIYAAGPARDEARYRWFCGVQELQCLIVDPDQKTQRYWASLFLPAYQVYMSMPQERGRPSVRSLEGVVIITDRDNNVLGRKVFGYKGNKLSVKRANALLESVGMLRGKKTQNQILLLPRELTPWAWLEAERFELPALDSDPGVKNNPPPGSGAPRKAADKGNEE